MKCIQSVKKTKNIEVGEIRRVNDKEADSEVKSGYWKYIPKSEWKSSKGKSKSNEEPNKEKQDKNVETQKKNKHEKNSK